MNERFAESSEPALSYYASLAPAAGFQGRCAMSIPCDIEGKRVLDICCRKGKGAFALADAVGPSGFVVGVDPDAGNIAAACAAAPKNHRAGSLWEHHLRFSQAIPENLSAARIDDAAFDLVYVNSVLNLAWSLPATLDEFARVLVPGGRLWVAQGVFLDNGSGVQEQRAVVGNDLDVLSAGTALADSDGTDSAMNARKSIAGGSGPVDVFSRALSFSEFEELCLAAGFGSVAFSSVSPISCEDLRNGECSGAATFCLADVCATI